MPFHDVQLITKHGTKINDVQLKTKARTKYAGITECTVNIKPRYTMNSTVYKQHGPNAMYS